MRNVVRCFAACKECSLNLRKQKKSAKGSVEHRLEDGIPIALITGSRDYRVNRQYLHIKFIHNGNRTRRNAIMKEGMKIKVIKRGEIKAPVVKTLKKSKRASARDMVSNVTNWVNDLQARKRDETKVAIEKFFNNSPQPSEL